MKNCIFHFFLFVMAVMFFLFAGNISEANAQYTPEEWNKYNERNNQLFTYSRIEPLLGNGCVLSNVEISGDVYQIGRTSSADGSTYDIWARLTLENAKVEGYMYEGILYTSYTINSYGRPPLTRQIDNFTECGTIIASGDILSMVFQ